MLEASVDFVRALESGCGCGGNERRALREELRAQLGEKGGKKAKKRQKKKKKSLLSW